MPRLLALFVLVVASCGHSSPTDDGGPGDAATGEATADAATLDAAADVTLDAGACTTRIQYGSAWTAPMNHPNDYDVASGLVTWDGVCTDDGKAGCVNQTGCSRWPMLDAIAWGTDGWPRVLLAPSSTTRPLF